MVGQLGHATTEDSEIRFSQLLQFDVAKVEVDGELVLGTTDPTTISCTHWSFTASFFPVLTVNREQLPLIC